MLDDLIAVCGVSCAQCRAYTATRAGGRTGLESVAAEWTKTMGRTFTSDDVVCDGCRVPDGRHSTYCATCDIRNCAQGKGTITCAHCAECPCEKIVAPEAREALATLRRSI